MITVLVLGDAHIPERAQEVPHTLKRKIEELAPVDVVISPGDYTTEDTMEWIASLGEKALMVVGNCDFGLPLPPRVTEDIGEVKVTVDHGGGVHPRGDPDQLAAIAEEEGADVIFTGHTHRPEFMEHRGVLIVNPGSLTGVPSGGGPSPGPSFMYGTIDGREVWMKLYMLKGDRLETEEFETEL
jgi:putative phosphoesterase